MKTIIKTNARKENDSIHPKGEKIPAKPGAAQGLGDIFKDSLKDIYWAENALTKDLPKMIRNASSEKLGTAIAGHLEVTRDQVAGLEEVLAQLE